MPSSWAEAIPESRRGHEFSCSKRDNEPESRSIVRHCRHGLTARTELGQLFLSDRQGHWTVPRVHESVRRRCLWRGNVVDVGEIEIVSPGMPSRMEESVRQWERVFPLEYALLDLTTHNH